MYNIHTKNKSIHKRAIRSTVVKYNAFDVYNILKIKQKSSQEITNAIGHNYNKYHNPYNLESS